MVHYYSVELFQIYITILGIDIYLNGVNSHGPYVLLLLLYKPITVLCDEKMETRTVPPPPTTAFSVVAVMFYNITHRYNIRTRTPILYNIYIYIQCVRVYLCLIEFLCERNMPYY